MNQEEVEKLANLARIKTSSEELKELGEDIESIVKYISQIQEAELSTDIKNGDSLLRNVMREDGEPHSSGEYTQELLEALPQREDNYMKVKKIL